MRAILGLAFALIAAGCVTPAENVDSATTDAMTADPLATATAAFSFDGEIGAGAGACPVVTCIGQYPADNSGKAVEFTGTLVATNLTLTWEASSPTTENLYFGLWWGTSEDEEGQTEYVEGTSPLTLELSELDITDENDVWVWAWPVSAAPMGIADAHPAQPFLIEGDVTSAPTPPEPPAS